MSSSEESATDHRFQLSGLLGPGVVPVFVLLGIAMASCRTRQPVEVPPEHLVLVVFDTLRADRMSLYGHHEPTTPFLERMAREALVFEDVKAPAPWTVPSHASMFTGLPPSLHKAQWGRVFLADEFQTLAETLAAQGFCTVALSANGLVSRSTGLLQGFEKANTVKGPYAERSQKILARLDQVLEDLLRQECRLFIYLNFMDTHIPYNTGRHGEQFGARGPGPVKNPKRKWEISAGQRRLSEDEEREHQVAYEAAVRYSDDMAQELTGQLARRGILDTSLLILTSDHGDGLGAHREMGHALSLWEEQLAVPLMVRLPRGARSGERVAERTTLTALMPSILDWLGVARPEYLAAAPNLEEAAQHPIVADYRSYFSESNRTMNQRVSEKHPQLPGRTAHAHAFFCGDYKLIVRADGDVGFFDLVSDPEEQSNLASESSGQLKDCLRGYRQAVESGRLTDFAEVVSKRGRKEAEERIDLETLRSLGYIQ